LKDFGMTAEIVIMNREAAVIAADSAVSLMTGEGGAPQKIFTSANKIFEISREHAVCIMVYNNAVFMGMPWEPVILPETHRKKRERKAMENPDTFGEHLTGELLKPLKDREKRR
jgi:hypothetical protein